MTGFTPYVPRSLDKKAEAPPAAPAPGGAMDYKPKEFDAHPAQRVVDLGEKNLPHFRLDGNVAEQLGIEEKRRAEFEQRVQGEIERRWQKASEKAQVEGFQSGLEKGKKQAYEAELPRIQERLNRVEAVLQECDKMRERIFLANEAFLMDLISQVARMVVLKEVELDKEYLHRVVISLLHQLGTKEDMKITVSDQDFAVIEALRGAVEKEFGKLTNTAWEHSPQVPAGGVRIDTRFGVIDASVQTQIENVMRALKA
ncbi:MAG: hypothetical protein HUU37_00195 [Bdellovibrionales bacterium]|nr:hypothetical protein [Bdellovibrionales bacterium]